MASAGSAEDTQDVDTQDDEQCNVQMIIDAHEGTQSMLIDTLRNQAVIADALGGLTETFHEMRLQGTMVKRIELCRDLGKAISDKVDSFVAVRNATGVFGVDNEFYEAAKVLRKEHEAERKKKEKLRAKKAVENATAGTRRRRTAVSSASSDSSGSGGDDDAAGGDGGAAGGATSERKKAKEPKKVVVAQPAPKKTSTTVAQAQADVTKEKLAVGTHVADVSFVFHTQHNMIAYGLEKESGCIVVLVNPDDGIKLPEEWDEGIRAAAGNVASKETRRQDLKKSAEAIGEGAVWVLRKFLEGVVAVPVLVHGEVIKQAVRGSVDDFLDAQPPLLASVLRYVSEVVDLAGSSFQEQQQVEVMKLATSKWVAVVRGLAAVKPKRAGKAVKKSKKKDA